MMRMPSWEVCHDANAPVWVCRDANVLMVHAMMRMQPCRYVMNANAPLWVYHDTECFGARTIYSKIHFIFKTRLPQRLKPKYFQTQFIIPEKSSSF